ncbi:MAG TPA: ChaN family lipoprotein [Planctomycetota bacterium]|nr:ChaN family lipoprotein [Planctomycetota bacterium]
MIRRLLMLSFAALTPPLPAQARPLPPLDAATSVWDTAAAQPLGWSELLDRLAKVDVVFLGETHVDDTTHRVELHVLQELLARRPGKVVLSLEMFERDVQAVLDDYLQGRIDEPAFLAKARPWSNYRTAYRPLVEAAKAVGIPVVAANFPVGLRRKLAQGGKQTVDSLPEAERALMPADIFPASDAYWERVERAVRGHMGGGGAGTPEERLYDAQNLWDNAMGDSVAKARAAHRECLVLHVAGGFHTAYRDGTVAQFRRRCADASCATVAISPTPALHTVRAERDKEVADFLVYAAALARDLDEGTYAVEVPSELRYRLEVPAHGTQLPLFVWLPDRRTRPEDAFAFWRLELGDAAAVAVVEQPFPEVQDDLANGGRYVSGDGFRADYGRMQHGLAQIVEYATRRFPIDARAVVVAGAGDGGAVVLWTALYGEWLDCDMFAIDPNDLTRLSMEALPDQKPVVRSLQIVARNADATRLEKIAADYAKAGAAAKVVPLAGPQTLEDLLRLQLALPERVAAAAAAEPVQLVLQNDLPRARQWAELYAANLRGRGIAARVVTAADVPAGTASDRIRHLAVGGNGHWPLSAFANGDGLPLAGGPFGGTTVVVLPKGIAEAERTAWLEHEQKKVIKRRSMFANIAVARSDAEPTLPQVIQQLRQRGRSRVLIVPAVFCADAATMRELKDQLGSAADGMDVSWLPGLGAALAASER